MTRLTHADIVDYARGAVDQMSSDDRESFRADPEAWRDGIEISHVIACRDGKDIYISDHDEWCEVRDAILAELADLAD